MAKKHKKSEIILPQSSRKKSANSSKSSKTTGKSTKVTKITVTTPSKTKPATKPTSKFHFLAKTKTKSKSAQKRGKGIKGFFKWWFSKPIQIRFWKVVAACFLVGIILLGVLFLYYRQDLKDIELSDLTISETVNTYLDRNGKVLWEDTGTDDYRLVVDGSEISSYMRQATVAIEDKNFYNHIGVDPIALVRAVLSTLSGRGVQGGSTLTQQLIKQVYFSSEAASANRGGITRKIKELILALELEKMYDKEQIITMYLNQSPYGGRRNGVESAAQTYFGKTAAELDLAESALLASIPNNPAILNPYNEYGHDGLIARQHKTLDSMVSMGYISQEEADAAKEIDILDRIQPESSQYAGMTAPHFLLEVRDQLYEKYGYATINTGGYTITTTLDAEAQKYAEQSVKAAANDMKKNGSDNMAFVSLDVETSQVIAMIGSVDFYNSTYGEFNAATSGLEPGSTIKPVLDYGPLFMEREGINYAPGIVIKDENIDKFYCSGYVGSCKLRNYYGNFNGDVTIRYSLSRSLNIPAVKALKINTIEKGLETLHALGDKNYCANSENYGYAVAIGSGCEVLPIEHANAYASLARGGVYKDYSYILEVKDSNGNVLESWEDSAGERVIDEQVAYMITSILYDAASINGSAPSKVGNVWNVLKTGTTTTANSAAAKDLWVVGYSPTVVTAIWNGKHDGTGLKNDFHNAAFSVYRSYMSNVHNKIYAAEGKWKANQKITAPAGIKTLTVAGHTDIFPSWYNPKKNSGIEEVELSFNKYNGKLAATCTNSNYITTVTAYKTYDEFWEVDKYTNIPKGYDRETEDDCSFVLYTPSVYAYFSGGDLKIHATKGSFDLKSYEVTVDGEVFKTGSLSDGNATVSDVSRSSSIKITVYDSYGNAGYYSL